MNYNSTTEPMKCCDGCGQSLPTPEPTTIGHAQDVFNLCRFNTGSESQERFEVIILDSRNHILGSEIIALGSVNTVHVSPVDALRPVLTTKRAVSMICVHNHPSGDTTPSPEDRRLTERMTRAASLLGIKFLDHIIVTASNYYSFSDAGEL